MKKLFLVVMIGMVAKVFIAQASLDSGLPRDRTLAPLLKLQSISSCSPTDFSTCSFIGHSPVGGLPLQSPVHLDNYHAPIKNSTSFVLRTMDSGMSILDIDYNDYDDYDDYDVKNSFIAHQLPCTPRLKALFNAIENYQIDNTHDIICDMIKDRKLSLDLAIKLNKKMDVQNKRQGVTDHHPKFRLIEKVNNSEDSGPFLIPLKKAEYEKNKKAIDIKFFQKYNVHNLQDLKALQAARLQVLYNGGTLMQLHRIDKEIQKVKKSKK